MTPLTRRGNRAVTPAIIIILGNFSTFQKPTSDTTPEPSHHKNPYESPFRVIVDPLLRKKRRTNAKPFRNAIGIEIVKSFKVNPLGGINPHNLTNTA
jgi:hypothetical protein